jgi:UDPglucose 6-dehydrogenase
MNLTIVGAGYVGLVTGSCLAEVGHNVLCVEIDQKKVDLMQSGGVPIYEPKLDEYFERNLKAKRLNFTTSLEEGVAHGNVIFLALPTPEGEDGSADLSYVLNVAKEIGKILKKHKIIVNKSTVPVGTAERVRKVIADQTDISVDVVSNPEFLREGFAIDDFMNPERIVIGSSSSKASNIMKEIYRPFESSSSPIIFMNEKSSELTKYAANAFLATKITFMNEIANYCEQVGANIDNVRLGVGTDSRIGSRFLFPGIGFGGSCFPKDIKALQKAGQEVHHKFSILESVIEVNEHQKTILFPKIKAHFKNQLAGKKIAVWGLAFKPDTDDIRKAPALEMIQKLLKEKAEVYAYDPEAMPNVKKAVGTKITFGTSKEDVLTNADALLICTEWSEFKNADITVFKSHMKTAVIFDGRNIFDPQKMKQQQIAYVSIGRP